MIWLRGVVDRMAVMPDRVVADRYLLEHTIGRGGIGTVWLAHDRLLDREVAVKEVSFPETLSQHQRDDLRARALREARAAARLDHPGATMYYAVEGEAPFERAGSLATLAAVVNEPPRPPRHAGALTPVLMSLLAKDPAARPGLRQVRIRLARVAAAGREDGADPGQPSMAGRGDGEAAVADGGRRARRGGRARRGCRSRAGACGDRAVAWQRRGRRARGRADPRDQRANDQPSGADRSTDDRLEGRRVADHLPATSGRGPRGARGLDQLHQPERRLCGRLPLRLEAQHRSGPARHVVQRGHRTLHQGGVRASPAGPGER